MTFLEVIMEVAVIVLCLGAWLEFSNIWFLIVGIIYAVVFCFIPRAILYYVEIHKQNCEICKEGD